MKFNLPIEFKKNLKKEGYFSLKKFLNEDEVNCAYEAVRNYLSKNNKNLFELNYGGSEIRIWNSQILIPEINHIYEKLRKLNEFIFNDKKDFCMLIIINEKCEEGFYSNRWHADSFKKQYKFFLHLTKVDNSNGPFEFVPRTHKLINKLFRALRGFTFFYPYFKIKGLRVIPTYSQIEDDYIGNLGKSVKFTCHKGDLLVCDVRMLHRDSPCISNERIAIHCYLGIEPNKFPNFVEN